jgi:DNA-binding CsgD family transcriptional regulator
MLNLEQTKNDAINAYQEGNVMNNRGLRKKNLPHIYIWVVYHVWVVVCSTLWMASPLTENVFGYDPQVLMYSVTLISSGICISIIKKEWFEKTARTGVLLLIAGMILHLTLHYTSVKLIMAVTIGISLGLVNISILMSFVFTLNNTEKLYAMAGCSLLTYIILLLQKSWPGGYLQNSHDLLLSFVIIVFALSPILFIKKTGIPANDADIGIDCPKFCTRIYLTLFFNFIIVILCIGVGRGILNIAAGNGEYPALWWYYFGGVIGSFIYIGIYRYNSKPFIWLGNITFSSFAMGLFCSAFIERSSGMAVAFAILLGISNAVGIINIYYIIGVVGKKYNSMHYLKLSVLFIGVGGGISGMIIGNFIQRANSFEISMVASVISVVVMLLFIMLSPMVSQSHYYNDWAKDSEKTEIDNEQVYMFKKYQLSKREIEVCKLLLQGYTMRQISGILSIAYSTVNTYCTSTYRKLGINSRTELLILFKDYI